MLTDELKSLETTFTRIFVDRAPKLPEGFTTFLVKILPYLTLTYSLVVVTLFGFSAIALAFIEDESVSFERLVTDAGYTADNPYSVFLFSFGLLTTIVLAVIYLKGYRAARLRQKYAWDLWFYASIVSVFASFARLGAEQKNMTSAVIGAILGIILSFYLLFQIRSYYLPKPAKKAKNAVSKSKTSATAKPRAKKK
jgi:uncharacterized membrane protein YciS (DUF1049 family)